MPKIESGTGTMKSSKNNGKDSSLKKVVPRVNNTRPIREQTIMARDMTVTAPA